MVTDQRGNVRGREALWSLRVVAAVMLVVMAGVHLWLWFDGFSDIPVIGPGFLADAVGGFVLAVVLMVPGTRWLTLVAAVAGLFTLGSLIALLLSLTVGLFGVQEQWGSVSVLACLVSEAVALVALIVIARRSAAAALAPAR
ncbi:hypothetical protein [Pseudonocardia sp. GCM10023141]|uniref:hypothetical protein n=1 Tax=Pseudonocardia sp. GCM10023141 TaxID=3252653 RepID=UPI0036151218